MPIASIVVAKNVSGSIVTLNDILDGGGTPVSVPVSGQVTLTSVSDASTVCRSARLREEADPAGTPTLTLNDAVVDLVQAAVSNFLNSLCPRDRTATGTYTGTGAALTVALAFVPQVIEIYDLTAAAEVRAVKTDQMTVANGAPSNDSFLKVDTVGIAVVSSNGIDILTAVAASRYLGFDVGTDASINTAARTYYYVAHE